MSDAVSQVYARSLYELAEQAGGPDKIEEVGQELEEICELTRADRGFREFLGSPIIEMGRREEALRRIFADRVTDLMLRVELGRQRLPIRLGPVFAFFLGCVVPQPDVRIAAGVGTIPMEIVR